MSSYALHLLQTGKLKQKFGGNQPEGTTAPNVQCSSSYVRHKGLRLIVRNGELLCKCNAQKLPSVEGIDYKNLTLQEQLQLQTKVRNYLLKYEKFIIQKIQELTK